MIKGFNEIRAVDIDPELISEEFKGALEEEEVEDVEDNMELTDIDFLLHMTMSMRLILILNYDYEYDYDYEYESNMSLIVYEYEDEYEFCKHWSAKKSAMEIEVKQSNGVYAKAIVEQVSNDGIKVSYENDWKPSEQASFDRCRAVVTEGKSQPAATSAVKKAKVREIKGAFAVVDSVEGPSCNEIVSFDRCHSGGYEDLLFQSTVLQGFDDLVKNVHIESLVDTNQLRISSFSSQAIKSVKLLSDIFLSNAKQKMQLLQRQEEAKRMLSLSDSTAPFVEEFTVASELMGLAIGTHGSNITNARKIEGVEDVVIDESQRATGNCTFKVLARSSEAAEQARSLLEYVIGKSGRTIQEIVDKSGVVRVQIGDENPEQDDDEFSDMVDFIFTGTKEAITNSELLIQYHLKHLKEMEEMRESVDELHRKLHPDPFAILLQ
uniref:Uncharacterized protein n=1 Tax=Ditylenchus dipsaci TaxID=166011 RepID=A0A915CQ97_9BILA